MESCGITEIIWDIRHYLVHLTKIVCDNWDCRACVLIERAAGNQDQNFE